MMGISANTGYEVPADTTCEQARNREHYRYLLRGICTITATAICISALLIRSSVYAQETSQVGGSVTPKPPVRMRIELLSLRNRSTSPIPVQIKLEYNRPKSLEGRLELSLYDALDVVSSEDLRATVVVEDIFLRDTDYTFQTILPPLRTSDTQNLAIVAWFVTSEERIPLSSSLKELYPPVPHDLLMVSPEERACLVCSCHGGLAGEEPSLNRMFLNEALALENYNPNRSDSLEFGTDPRSDDGETGTHILNYATNQAVTDLSADPLTYCAFDLILLADGALGRISTEQMEAVTQWVQAGGSVCIVPDVPLKPAHLEFLRKLMTESAEEAFDGLLDDDGRLQLTGLQNRSSESASEGVLLRRKGLGRVALISPAEDLSAAFAGPALAATVTHLWKVRKSVAFGPDQPWDLAADLRERAKRLGLVYEQKGNRYLFGPDAFARMAQSPEFAGYNGYNRPLFSEVSEEEDGITERQMRDILRIPATMAPLSPSFVSELTLNLLPPGVETVPAWLIGVILCGYVLTIGPADYFILGFLKFRKATWVMFPFVTAFYTILTVVIAGRYMGSNSSGGSLEVIDIVDNGVPVRSSRMELSFAGARTTQSSSHRQELTAESFDTASLRSWNNLNFQRQNANDNSRMKTFSPIVYSGHFPQNYTATRTIQQWTPQVTRTFRLNPEVSEIPKIDWDDTGLITTSDGNARLRQILGDAEPSDAAEPAAAAATTVKRKVIVLNSGTLSSLQMFGQEKRDDGDTSTAALTHVESIIVRSTLGLGEQNFFRLVSRVSPQGSAIPEDLAMLDSTDPSEWVLLIFEQTDTNHWRVFRKLYHIPTSPDQPQSE
ncbi:MAG: hypothetical protein ACK526_17770 [Planctomyces sp.]|jgi:hypothetical protein